MDNNLKILDLYNNTEPKRVDSFNSNVHSEYKIESDYEKVEVNFEWLDLMEDTVRYLDNILRNPNRFIINEEEVVKIEQAKRITVESIKHLSKHTNFIQEIEQNGDVRPSKILNINKEESYNTYENRFIYTLIQNMQGFLDIKKKSLVLSSSLKDVKKCVYNGSSKVGAERINFNLTMDSKILSKDSDGKSDGIPLDERLEKLQTHIDDLRRSDVYKALAREHVARVIPPIKKTNVILKNTNFQYAMRLWNFLQENKPDDSKKTKSNKVYEDNAELKEMLDDVFMLNYLIVNSVDVDNAIQKDTETRKAIEELTNNMINKIVEINSDLPMEKLQEIIGDKIAIVKKEKEASIAEIQSVFYSRIQKVLNKVNNYKF